MAEHHAAALEAHGPDSLVHLEPDGSIKCRACGGSIVFAFPPLAELPDGAPATVNHTGCPKAIGSPAGAETINVLDPDEVHEYVKAHPPEA